MSCSAGGKSCFDYGGDRSYCISPDGHGGYAVSRYDPSPRSNSSLYDQFDRSSDRSDGHPTGGLHPPAALAVGVAGGDNNAYVASDLAKISTHSTPLKIAAEQHSAGVRQVQQSALQLQEQMSAASAKLAHFSDILSREDTLIRIRNAWQERHWQNLSTTLPSKESKPLSVDSRCLGPVPRECNEALQLVEGIRACVVEILGADHTNSLDEINKDTMSRFQDEYKKTRPTPERIRGLEKLAGKLAQAYQIVSCVSAFEARTAEMAALCQASDYARACHYIDEMIENDISK